jgi:glycerate dehydrogenase
MTTILVTFPADDDQRQTIITRLEPLAKIVFLSDVASEYRARELAAADIMVSWYLNAELQPSEFKIISNVKLLQLLSAGVDQIPLSQIPSTITVAGNAGAYADQMAEHVLAMILAIYKNLADRHNKLAKGIFDQLNENRRLRGSTCAVLGFGGIGKATARLLRCFGVRILAINSSGKTDEAVDFVGTLKDLEYVLKQADIVVVTLPLNNSTRGLIGSRQLGLMRNDATLVDVARAAIIDESALFQKLKTNPSFNAAIDTWWTEPNSGEEFHANYPFLTLPNVLGSPHNSALVSGAMVTGAAYAADNVKRFLKHETLLGVVNRSDYA